MKILAVSIGAIAVLAGSPGQAESFHLICIGGGAANRVAQTQAYVTNNEGNRAWATVNTPTTQDFEDQVNIDIDEKGGKIRVPRSMLPPMHGGKDGWFEIENLKVGDTEITGNAGVNFINSPKVRIDRTTGILSISGKSGNFSARCKPYDPANVQRAF